MKRWNGWGDDSVCHHLPDSALPLLEAWIGPGQPPRDATLEQAVGAVPPSRLPEHPLATTNPVERVRHARGQSLPDWVALRTGRMEAFPDGVAYPSTEAVVRTLLGWAKENRVALIPYGGGSSVVGHVNPLPGGRPTLTMDLARLNQLRHLDTISQLATFGAGVRGPDLEAQLRARGYTLGHYPQSFEFSTLGGWVVTRSTGQQSLYYGKIERTFVAGRLESPAGTLTLPIIPATAAGPDLREMVLGSEGRLGVLTEATVRIHPLPEEESFHALFFPHFDAGREAVREIVQSRIPLSMLRLSTAAETATNLALAGHERLIGMLERGLSALGKGEEKAMLMLGVTGRAEVARFARRAAISIARSHGATHVGEYMGKQWHRSRFTTPYLRNTLWEMGYAIDTLETAAPWAKIPDLITAIESATRTAMELENERVHVFTHISNVYPDGSSIYTSYLFRLQPDPDRTLELWRKMKSAASQAIVAAGGTISHQHGVGTDHLPYLPAEKGELGMAALRAACDLFDPAGIMNPGKLIA